MSKRKVGIVLLNFNGSEFLKYALDALLRAKTDVAFEAGVIDNGSAAKDAAAAQKHFEAYQKKGGKGFFIRSEENLGFSGGNNVVIKRFLEDPEITHLCLLNSDVLVTDYWLEYLTDDDYDVTGPVTNATGNEQTVAVDYEVQLNDAAFDVVNQFAAYRHNTYKTSVFESEKLNFFNTVFHRRVVEAIGLLDERFYPGSYEDDDYCLRTLKAGFRMMVIRGCYVHHFGSGSFSKLDMPDRVNISNVNRKRFEEKWNVKLGGDTWKLLQSCRQDMAQFENTVMDERSGALLAKTVEAAETLIRNWETGINWYQSEEFIQSIIQQYAPACEEGSAMKITPVHAPTGGVTYIESIRGRDLLYLLAKKVQLKLFQILHLPQAETLKNKVFTFPQYPSPTQPLVFISGKAIVRRIIRLAVRKLGLKRENKIHVELENGNISARAKASVKGQYPVIAELMEKLAQTNKRVVIHAPIFNEENERDGYIQRIKRVDEEIFDGYLRVYILEDGKRGARLGESAVDDQHYFITYNSHDPEQRQIVFALAELCGLQYIHSINRFMTDSVNAAMCELISSEKIKTVWDVHGSVPEEYLMYGSERGKEIGDELESFLYHQVDVIVVVNHAMQRHLMRKHGETDAKFVVMPIFNIDVKTRHNPAEVRKDESAIPAIVYAGGTQKWQNVELMQSIMEKTAGTYEYKIFVPDPREFNAGWKSGKPDHVLVDSKFPEELGAEYAVCDYGFVLRDESVVNYVACPTKIIEYLQYGVVPILKSPEIGDFVELGMQYVPYEKCVNQELPDKAAAAQMAAENYKVLDGLHTTYVDGVRDLREYLEDICTVKAGDTPAVGLVVTTFDRGGLEQIVLYLYRGYKKAGYRTYLLCQKDVLGSMAQQIDEGELLVFHDSETELMELMRKHGITNLHYHYNTFAMERMRDRGVKTVYTVHNTYIWLNDREIRERAEIMKHADRVVPVSEAVEHYFQTRTDGVCKNVQTIYNGISFEELSIQELPENLTREALGIEEGDVTLAFVASFFHAKGQTGMIGVMEKLIKKNPKIKLLLVGNVGHQAYYDHFEALLQRSPAKNNIIQVDYFDHRYMGEFLRRTADIFLLPTMQEGCSNAVLEAIFCDKPMIVTDVGNARQAEREAACVVVPTPYPDIVTLKPEELNRVAMLKDMPNQRAVVDAIMEMVDNLDEYRRKAQLTPEQKQQFSVDEMVDSYLDILRELNEK